MEDLIGALTGARGWPCGQGVAISVVSEEGLSTAGCSLRVGKAATRTEPTFGRL